MSYGGLGELPAAGVICTISSAPMAHMLVKGDIREQMTAYCLRIWYPGLWYGWYESSA